MLLDAIFHGEFCPEELRTEHCLQYTKNAKAFCKLQNELKQQVDAEVYGMVEKLLEQAAIVHAQECELNFKLGFSAGLKLAGEADEHLRRQLK